MNKATELFAGLLVLVVVYAGIVAFVFACVGILGGAR